MKQLNLNRSRNLSSSKYRIINKGKIELHINLTNQHDKMGFCGYLKCKGGKQNDKNQIKVRRRSRKLGAQGQQQTANSYTNTARESQKVSNN